MPTEVAKSSIVSRLASHRYGGPDCQCKEGFEAHAVARLTILSAINCALLDGEFTKVIQFTGKGSLAAAAHEFLHWQHDTVVIGYEYFEALWATEEKIGPRTVKVDGEPEC